MPPEDLHPGQTGPKRPVRVMSCILTRDLIGFRLLMGTDLPTLYIYEGPRPIEGNHNRFTQLPLPFILQTLTFPILSSVLRTSPRHSMTFWVACWPQSNPRSTSSDGVPSELEVLGLRGILCRTGLTGCPDRSDRSARRKPVGEDRVDDPHVLAHSSVWPNYVSTPRGLLASMTEFRALLAAPVFDTLLIL